MKIQLISICCALLWSAPMRADNAPHPPVEPGGAQRHRALADQRLCVDYTANPRKKIRHRRNSLEIKMNLGDVIVSSCFVNGVRCEG